MAAQLFMSTDQSWYLSVAFRSLLAKGAEICRGPLHLARASRRSAGCLG